MGKNGDAWRSLCMGEFHVAVLILAAGSGSLKVRLADAYVSRRIRLDKPAHQFPWLEIRRRFMHCVFR